MCGICGSISFTGDADRRRVERMVRALRHRGPDELGIYSEPQAVLGHARLSIIDLSSGRQPIHNEDRTVWITFNGEIFNYLELRKELVSSGHRFYTETDTEVLVHLYEEYGSELFSRINGQFAFVIWDSKQARLLAGRDRAGILPFFYKRNSKEFLFASEIKAFAADPETHLEINPRGVNQVFTGWATLPPETVFKDILELPPAHCLIADSRAFEIRRYWDMPFEPDRAPDAPVPSTEACAEELHALLLDSIRLRLRADVPVAAYLSGGLDSSLITAMVKKHFNAELHTFSVSFTDPNLDESRFQRQMASLTGTNHHEVKCGPADIGAILADVVSAAEKPLIRTAPGPLFLLSGLVRESGIKVVLTGEGADEILAGYDLFKEMKIRRFWAKNPSSRCRPLLLRRLYRDNTLGARRPSAFIEAYYRNFLSKPEAPCFSHQPRWETTSFIKSFYSDDFKSHLQDTDYGSQLASTFPAGFASWGPLSRAQYIEMATLLSGNLLSSQGDRMTMAHGIEGRYPFLDHRLMEFAARIPEPMRMNGLTEKYLLKKVASRYLPEAIVNRPKQAYRAPDSISIFARPVSPLTEYLLSPEYLKKSGCFDPAGVTALAAKCRNAQKSPPSNRHEIAMTGILTLQMLYHRFIENNQ